MSFFVIPAKAGTHEHVAVRACPGFGSWVPPCGGMTVLA
jgi:hypothetical protein